MSIKLRPYQQEALNAIEREWQNGVSDLLLVMATGGGKTVVFLELLNRVMRPGSRSLILAHRKELVDQPLERIQGMFPALASQAGIVMASQNEVSKPLVIATVQTLASQKRLRQLLAHGKFDYLITDEAHHATSKSYLTLYETLKTINPELKHLGVTATPVRADGDGLAKVYGKVAAKFGIVELIKQGYLSPVRWLAIQTGISLKGIRTQAGDFAARQLADVYETNNCFDLVVETHKKYASDRLAMAYTVSVEGAHHLAEAFNAAGIPAAAADGTTSKDERRAILRRFRRGEIRVLANCALFTEGLDVPEVSCIHQVRPTKSDGLYCLDEATEILTPDGWKTHTQLAQGELVASFDPETDRIEWQPAIAKIVRKLRPEERMIAIQSPSLDIRVTDKHRLIYKNRNTYSRWLFAEAERLEKRSAQYKIPVAGFQDAPGTLLTDDEIRFIGWFVTDGTLNPANNQITIYQAEHQPYHKNIISILDSCGFKYGVSRTERRNDQRSNNFEGVSAMVRYTISKGAPRGRDTHLSGWGRLEKYINKNLSPELENLDRRQLSIFLEAIHQGDGNKQRNQPWVQRSYHIATGNKSFADRLQSLCIRRGWRCNLGSFRNASGNLLYNVHIKDEYMRAVGGVTANLSDGRACLQETQSVAGELVWCVQTENGTIITRRNGKTAILGNCQIIGRALRTYPGKPDALILDYAPKNARNIAMFGDILGVPLAQKHYIKEAEEPEEEAGEVQSGFTFDGEYRFLDGNPMELVARELHYLELSPWAWHRTPDGWMTLGLGEGSDKIERTLVITPNGSPETYKLYLTAKRPEARSWQAYLVKEAPFEDLQTWTEAYANQRGNAVLAAKKRGWRNEPPSMGQIKFAQRLGVFERGLSKGELADRITFKLAYDAVERMPL